MYRVRVAKEPTMRAGRDVMVSLEKERAHGDPRSDQLACSYLFLDV